MYVCHVCERTGPAPIIFQLGPFAGGVPLTTALPFGAEPSSQGGSLMDRSFSNTQLTGQWHWVCETYSSILVVCVFSAY